MRLRRLGVQRIAGLGVLGLLLACPASATVIVDTGPGPGRGGWFVRCDDVTFQWLAAEFTLAEATSLTSVEGWMRAYTGTPHATVAIYADGGNVPAESPLYLSTPFAVRGAGWYGVGGVHWPLSAGTWWVAFQAHEGWAVMPVLPTSPLVNEVYSLDTGASWSPLDLNLGVRIEGEPMPEPSTMLLVGSGLLGLIRFRRRG
jgi:hypothetical protein